MIPRKIRIAVAGILAVAAGTAAAPVARAEEPTPAWLRASFLLDGSQKLLEEVGLPLPLDREVRGNLERAPFMGPGAIAGDKPLGVLIYPVDPNAGERLERTFERGVVIAIPVNKGFAPLENLAAFAKEQDPDSVVKGDTVTSRRMNIRRLADYVLAAPGTRISQGTNDAFKADYKNAGTLASATLDLAAFRKHSPKAAEAFWDEVKGELPRHPGERKMAMTVVEAIRRQIDAIDTVSAAVSRDQTTLRATAVVSPINIKPTLPAMQRPTFPAGTILQIHVAYPNAEIAAWLPTAIEKFDLKDVQTGAGISENDQAILADGKALVGRAAKLLTAEAQSIGVIVDAGSPIVLVVNQYAKAPDVIGGLKALAVDVNAARKKHGESKLMEIEEVAAGGQKAARILFLDREQPMGYMDVAQAGNKVAITLSQGKVEKVAGLLAAPAKGQMSDFVQASLDLGEAFKAAESTGNLPIPDQIAQKIRAALADKSVQLVVKSTENGKSMLAEASIPIALLKDLGEVLGGLVGRGEVHMNSEPMPPQPAQ